jgi:hypothetical protein
LVRAAIAVVARDAVAEEWVAAGTGDARAFDSLAGTWVDAVAGVAAELMAGDRLAAVPPAAAEVTASVRAIPTDNDRRARVARLRRSRAAAVRIAARSTGQQPADQYHAPHVRLMTRCPALANAPAHTVL